MGLYLFRVLVWKSAMVKCRLLWRGWWGKDHILFIGEISPHPESRTGVAIRAPNEILECISSLYYVSPTVWVEIIRVICQYLELGWRRINGNDYLLQFWKCSWHSCALNYIFVLCRLFLLFIYLLLSFNNIWGWRIWIFDLLIECTCLSQLSYG